MSPPIILVQRPGSVTCVFATVADPPAPGLTGCYLHSQKNILFAVFLTITGFESSESSGSEIDQSLWIAFLIFRLCCTLSHPALDSHPIRTGLETQENRSHPYHLPGRHLQLRVPMQYVPFPPHRRLRICVPVVNDLFRLQFFPF